MKSNFSTYMYCREDVLNARKNSQSFCPARWQRKYVSRAKISEGVRSLLLEFNQDFDVCEEYSVENTAVNARKLIYKIFIYGKGGELGFLFQIQALAPEKQFGDLRQSQRSLSQVSRINH